MDLPGQPMQKWAFSLTINSGNALPGMSCGVSLDGKVTNLSLAGTQTLSPSLTPGNHQLALESTENKEFVVRPGGNPPWDRRENATTDITMIIDAIRQ